MTINYEKIFKVAPFECDMNGNIHLARIMGHMQEIANEQLSIIDLSYEKLAQNNMAFLLSSMGIKINKLPKMEQQVVMITYPEPSKGAKFYRTVIVKDMEGSILLVAKTVWLLVDIQNRKILRPSVFFDQYYFETKVCDLNLDYLSSYKRPKNQIFHSTQLYTVEYSDIDVNNHVNNAKYVEIIFNILPIQTVTTKKINTLHITFINEAKLGNTIKLDMALIDEHTHHIVGSKQNQDCFHCTVDFI